MKIAYILFSLVQVFVCIAIIFLVAIQRTKNEGLGGTIEGRSFSNFKGKAGFEDRLVHLTRMLGVAFFVSSLVVAILANR